LPGAVVGARILPDRAVSALPLVVAEASAVVADAIVVTIIGALRHGAVEPRPALVAKTLHGPTSVGLLGANAGAVV